MCSERLDSARDREIREGARPWPHFNSGPEVMRSRGRHRLIRRLVIGGFGACQPCCRGCFTSAAVLWGRGARWLGTAGAFRLGRDGGSSLRALRVAGASRCKARPSPTSEGKKKEKKKKKKDTEHTKRTSRLIQCLEGAKKACFGPFRLGDHWAFFSGWPQS